MWRKHTQSKAPLSRRKVQDQKTGQDDNELNATIKNDGLEITKTVVSPKLKCYSRTRWMTASSSNDDQCHTSAFDYNSDEDASTTVKDNVSPSGVKRKRESSKDDDLTSLPGSSRYKKSQQAINLIKKSDEREKKYGKKRKGRKDKSSTSSDEGDFDQPVKKSYCLLVPDIELVKLTSSTTQGRSKKSLLNLRKNKRNTGTDDQHSEESNVDSATESGTVNQKKYRYQYSESAEDDADGDDERDDDHDHDDDEDGIDILEHHNNKWRTKLENEAIKENMVKTISEIKCPVCSKEFDEFMEQGQINEHVNSCLDNRVTSTAATEDPENNPKSSLSILKVKLVDFEYQRKEMERRDVGFGGEELFFCQICQKDLSKMNSQRRQQHINKCCDQMEKVSEEEKMQATGRDDAKKNALTCPFCSQEFKSRKSWQAHLKKCGQDNNVPPIQVIEIARQQEQYQQDMESTSHQTEERAKGRPNEDGKKKTGQAKKKRKVGQDLRNVDEETQLAMALSASMAPPAPPGNDDRKPKRKRKKDNEVIPALLLRSKEETQNVIAARAAQVVCNKDDDSDEDRISCTPALAPSTLAEQFLKVEQANANIVVKDGTKDQMTEETKGGLTETSNQIKKELKVKEEDISCTPDTSSKPVSPRCGDTTVVLLSDMLASPDMCRSFLSFLDVPDEEAFSSTEEVKRESSEKPTTEVKKDISEQQGMSVMVGRSAPLWTMASLGNPESSTKDFYVSGLLQMPSPKRPKKTPRKSSSTSQRKGSAHAEAQEEMVKNTEKSKEDMIGEDRKEENLEQLNKTMSESELTSVSQAANLDILLELAGDGDDDDNNNDDDDSQDQPRKSSVNNENDDDDEVFPSSGFCLPVGCNNQPDKVENNVPSSLSLFLQDMSKMVGNTLLSDVTILTKGNESIPAHSFMLASRSQILANMIREAQNVTDGQQPTGHPVHLSFNDVETDAMYCILQYIYTASVNVQQSCIVDVISLAERLELYELVKACQYSRTIHEERQEKQGSEDQEENGIRCSLSAEQLLDAIWQDGAGKEDMDDNQEQSQNEWQFDDDDIEEVRIFQTQAVWKRTRSQDTGQEPFEEILNLDAENKEIESEEVQILRRTPSETDVSDRKKSGVKVDELQLDQNEIKLQVMQESRDEREVKEASDLETTTLNTGCLEEKYSKQLGAKELKHRCSYRKVVCDDQERDFNCGDSDTFKEKERNLVRDIQMTGISYDDIDKHNDDDDGRNQESSHDCHSVYGQVDLTEDDDDRHDDADETNQESAQKKYKVDLTEDDDDDDAHDDQNNVQTRDKNTSQYSVKLGKFNLKEEDDENNEPAREDDTSEKAVRGSECDLTDVDEQDKGKITSRVTDQNVSPSGCTQYKDIDEESHEHENYKSSDEESEEEYGAGDIAILNQSISLLSDDNDGCQSPEKVPDNYLVIPETPHPKKRQRQPSSEDNQGHERPSQHIIHPLDTPTSYSPPSDDAPYNSYVEYERDQFNKGERERDNELLNEDENVNEKDHVSEDEEAFLEKLKSRVQAKAKNAEKQNKKGKGKKKAPKNPRARKNKGTKDTQKRLRISPRVSTPKNNPCVVDISMDSETEDLMSESAANQFDSGTRESDLERDTLIRDDSSSNKDDQESCSSLSPPRMLSPRVPSPCYSDFDHEMPSPSVSPTHPGVTAIDVSHSPLTTTPLRRFSGELQNDRSPKALKGEEGTVETRLSGMSQRMAVLIKEKALDSDQESEISEEVSLFSESTAHSDGKTDDQEKKTVEVDNERRKSMVSPCRAALVHEKPLDGDQKSQIGKDVPLLPMALPHSNDNTDDKRKRTVEDKDDERRISRQSPPGVTGHNIRTPTRFTISGDINTKASLFKRLKAAKYGLESTETEVSSDEESAESGLDSTQVHTGNSQTGSQTKRPGNHTPKSQGTTSYSPIPSQNNFYDDGGYNCDVDDFGACLDGDDSFMAHAAEQLELMGKQVKPVTQEKPDQQEAGLVKPPSPAQARSTVVATPRNNRTHDTSTDSPITPMPNYDDMTTPDLKMEIKKFGVRALPKKKMKAKLVEMYHYTHPGADAQQTQVNDNAKNQSSKTTKDPARTAKTASKTVASSQPPREPVKKKRIPASQVRESSDPDDDGHQTVRPSSQRPSSFKPSRSNTSKDLKRRTARDIDAGSSRSCSSSQPVSTLRRTENDAIESASSSDDDRATGRGSHESNNEEQEEFGEVSILVERETDTATQQVNSDNLDTKLLSFIDSNQDIYLKVISYQPIDLMALHELIKSSGIKCRVGQLIDFLDVQGITFTTAGQKPRQRRNPTRKRR